MNIYRSELGWQNLVRILLLFIIAQLIQGTHSVGQSQLTSTDEERLSLSKMYTHVSVMISNVRSLSHQDPNRVVKFGNVRTITRETLADVGFSDIPSNDRKWLNREIESATESSSNDSLSLESYALVRGNIIRRDDSLLHIDITEDLGIYSGAKVVAVKDGESVGEYTVVYSNTNLSYVRFPSNKPVDWVIFRRRMPSYDLDNPANSLIGKICDISFSSLLDGKGSEGKVRIYEIQLDRTGDVVKILLGSGPSYKSLIICESGFISSLTLDNFKLVIDETTGYLVSETEHSIRVANRARQDEAARVEAAKRAEKERNQRFAQIQRQRAEDDAALHEAQTQGRIIQARNNSEWQPAPGYRWLNPEWINNRSIRLRFRIATIWTPGLRHPRYEHVIASNQKDIFVAEDGYRFLNDKDDDMRVSVDRGNSGGSSISAKDVFEIALGFGAIIYAANQLSGGTSGSSNKDQPVTQCAQCSGTGKWSGMVESPTTQGLKRDFQTRSCPTCDGKGYY